MCLVALVGGTPALSGDPASEAALEENPAILRARIGALEESNQLLEETLRLEESWHDAASHQLRLAEEIRRIQAAELEASERSLSTAELSRGAAWRSALFPGWGQVWAGRDRGWIYGGGFLALAGLSYSAFADSQQARAAYASSPLDPSASGRYDRAYARFNGFFLLTLAWWAVAVADGFCLDRCLPGIGLASQSLERDFSAPPNALGPQNVGPDPGQFVRLSFQVRF